MREILFRGRRVDNGEWIKGGYYKDYCYGNKLGEKTYITKWNTFGLGFIDNIQVDHNTIGQFTGLTDKNGNKIWEGDIVSYEDISGVEDGVGNVLFDLLYGAWIVFVNDYEENSLADVAYNCEIIGNIHDNPKLLS